MLDRAIELLERGFHVFPLGAYGETPPDYFIKDRFDGDVAKATAAWPKQPRISWKPFQSAAPSEDMVRSWWARYPNANIGIACGAFIVVDADSQPAAEWCKANLPHTPWRVKTSSGMHFYYQSNPGCEIRNSADPKAKIDTRGLGGYVVAGGSRHSSGVHYVDDLDPDINHIGVTDLPMLDASHMAAIIAFRNQNIANGTQAPAGTGNLAGFTPIFDTKADGQPVEQGGRNNAAASLAGQYIRQGMSLRDVKSLLDSWNSSNPQPLSDSELNTTVASVARTHQTNHPDQPIPAEPEPVVVTTRNHKVPPKFPAHLLRPPGLVGDIADLMNRTAIKRQPILSMAASLCLCGTIMGRKVRTATDLRTNIYVLAVADSGAGKDHPRKMAKKLLDSAGALHLVGAEDLASDAGLFATLTTTPACLLLLDEFGRFLQQCNSFHAPAHLRAISTLLLRLTGAANGPLVDKKRAEHARGEAIVVQHPNVSLFGTTVPNRLIGAIKADDIADGFIPRLLMFISDDPDPDKQSVIDRAIPADITELIHAWVNRPTNAYPRGNMDLSINPLIVDATPDAQLVFDAYEAANRTRRAKTRGGGQGLDAIWARADEHALQLALIVACGCSFDNPVIDRAHAEWACELVTFLSDRMIMELDDNIAENEHESAIKKVLRFIGEHGSVGREDLMRKFRSIKREAMDGIISTLTQTEEITTRTVLGRGRPKIWYDYLSSGK